MKPLTLYPHEIRRLLDTGSVTVWRPMKPQPKWDTFGGYEAWRWKCKGGHVHVWDEGRDPDEVAFVNQCVPHPPGSERWVREVWRRPDCSPDTPLKEGQAIQYQAKSKWHDGFGDPWRSPVTMPRWASRLSVTVAGVEARQVQSVTEQEARDAGLADLTAFSEWWQTRFDTLGPDPWAWATTLTRKDEG